MCPTTVSFFFVFTLSLQYIQRNDLSQSNALSKTERPVIGSKKRLSFKYDSAFWIVSLGMDLRVETRTIGVEARREIEEEGKEEGGALAEELGEEEEGVEEEDTELEEEEEEAEDEGETKFDPMSMISQV